MRNSLVTKRLLLTDIGLTDDAFINALVNTPGWIRFIGDRNVLTLEQAKVFIQKIQDDTAKKYWVVKLPSQVPIGVITFMKRDYLEHPDIGFAFLPEYTKQGYAHEAALAILKETIKNSVHKHILATTIKDNVHSIKLLEKLGLRFEREIEHANDVLSVYSAAVDKLLINHLTSDFFDLFTNAKGAQPAWEKLHSLCLAEAIIIKKTIDNEEIYDLNSFIEPRKQILSDGTLTEFEECETAEETKIVGNLAQRFSSYQKKGYLNGNYFEGKGSKLFQYFRTSKGWRINSVIWEDENR